LVPELQWPHKYLMSALPFSVGIWALAPKGNFPPKFAAGAGVGDGRLWDKAGLTEIVSLASSTLWDSCFKISKAL